MDDNELVAYFRQCNSIKECARHFGVSAQKARRILVHAGEYTSPTAEKINSLYAQGYTAKQIAEKIGIGFKAVQGYIPYTKGQYKTVEPTMNALRIRACREKKLRKFEGD